MTDAWPGAIVFGPVFVLLVVLLRARRHVSSGGQTHRREVLPAAYEAAVWRSLQRSPGQCESCGAHNDPEFTYCQECQAKLE